MQVASPSSFLRADIQKEVGSAFSSGNPVTTPLAKPAELLGLHSYLKSEARLVQDRYGTYVVKLHPSTVAAMKADGLDVSSLGVGAGTGAAGIDLDISTLVFGAGTGATAGSGVGLIVMHHSPLALTIGCTLVGAAAGIAVASGFMEVVYSDGKLILRRSR